MDGFRADQAGTSTRRASSTPGRDHRRAAAGREPAHAAARALAARARGGRLHRHRLVPRAPRRHHVPAVPRHPRRAPHRARPRRPAARGAVGRDPARRPRPRRGAHDLHRLQGLPDRVPGRRRYGLDQGAAPRRAPRRGRRRRRASGRSPTRPRHWPGWPACRARRTCWRARRSASCSAAGSGSTATAGCRCSRRARSATLTDGRYGPRRVDVALFVDTFTQWLEPDIGLAALDYLDAAGAHPAVAPNVCCGRTYISAGMLDEARQLAVENVRRLLPLATSGVPIVGLEPSCILTLRDELTKLLPGDDDARTVSRHVLLFEEALDRWETPRLNPLEAAVIVHPHCHTKALARPGATAEAIGRIPAARVEMLDAGCCGMAGSFGYRSETYDLSVAMAKDRLRAGRQREPGRDRGRAGHVVPRPDRRPRCAPRRASGAAAGRSARRAEPPPRGSAGRPAPARRCPTGR